MSEQFENAAEHVLASIRAGASINESALAAGVAVATVRRWLTNGRKGGPTAVWAAAVDEARAEREQAEQALDEPLTDQEADALLARAARQGSILALKLYFGRRDVERGRQAGASAREVLAGVFSE